MATQALTLTSFITETDNLLASPMLSYTRINSNSYLQMTVTINPATSIVVDYTTYPTDFQVDFIFLDEFKLASVFASSISCLSSISISNPSSYNFV